MSTQTTVGTAESKTRFQRFWRGLRLVLLAVLFLGGTMAILLFPILPGRAPYDLKVGDVAPEDISAPREISYVSQLETSAAQQAAAAQVADIYDTPDPRVGRQQVRKARQIMDFVQDVRADAYADTALKDSYLAMINALNLTPEMANQLLQISDAQFQQISTEVVALIEEAMSGPVREGHVEDVTSRLELKVSPDMPEDLIPLTVGIAKDLIVPNSVLNVAATEAARQQAVASVPDIRRNYQPGEVVVRAGQRVDATDIEALGMLGLAVEKLTWQRVASIALLSLLSTLLLAVFLGAYETTWLDEPIHLLLMVVLFLLFLIGAQIMVPGQRTLAYLFPAAALIMGVTALVGPEFAALIAVILALLCGYLANNSLEVTAYVGVSSLLAAGSLRRTTRLNSFFVSGLIAALGGLATLLAFQIPSYIDTVRLTQLVGEAAINGLMSAGLALAILFVVGSLTGITTSLRLIDLMRPDHPLQRRLQQEALGTYQHTLSVANLVEAAAEAIGADSLLARVGTLYHDIGKTNNPGFFIENRTEGGSDPHKGLSPLASARIIKAHVTDGAELAQRYRLPPRVAAFITEHHGTTPIAYFLHSAREEAQAAGIELDEKPYFYDGPRPRSPETAILMIADGCESATRANRPASAEEVEEIVTRIIQQRIDLNQLDNSGLTLTHIKVIKDSIVRTLKGMYHPRVKYPGDKRPEMEAGKVVVLPASSMKEVGEKTTPSAAEAEPGTTQGAAPGLPGEGKAE